MNYTQCTFGPMAQFGGKFSSQVRLSACGVVPNQPTTLCQDSAAADAPCVSMLAAVSVVAGSAVVSTKRIALVTGANKGIGKEVARLLGALPDHAVVLGCRDEKLGMAAAAELQAEGCDAAYCWVDLADPSSFESARAFVEREYGRLDALVNNAAVCYNDPTLYGKVAHTPFEQLTLTPT